MVGDLVVARERRVHRGPAAHHVRHHAEHDEVADEHAQRRAQERVDAAAVAARPDVAAALARRGEQLEPDLPAEQRQRPRDVRAVGQEGPVAGVGALLLLHPADGEDHLVGLAGEEVAAARAAAREQPAPRRQSRARSRRSRPGSSRRRRARRLLHPAEGRDVVVGAEQDARPGWRRSARTGPSPTRRARVAVVEPARQVGGVAAAHRPPSTGSGEPVDLEEDDPRHVAALDDALAPGHAPQHPQDDSACSSTPSEHAHDQRDAASSRTRQQRRPEGRRRGGRRGGARAATSRRGVDQQHEQEAERKRVRQGQRATSGGSTAPSTRHDGDDEGRARRVEPTPGAIQAASSTATTETSSVARRLPTLSEKRGASPPAAACPASSVIAPSHPRARRRASPERGDAGARARITRKG